MSPAKSISRGELWLLGAALLAFGLIAVTMVMAAEEDAFIYYRYAWNWAHGQGLVFNPGDPVEGFSGPLWMAILALVAGAGLDLPRTAPALGIVAGGATLIATWWLTRILGLCRSARLATVATLAISYPFVVWARSGLETPLYSLALVVACAAYLAVEYGEEGSPAGSGLRRLAAVAPLFVCLGRPEGAMFVAVLVADRLADSKTGRRDWRGALRYAMPAAVGYGAYVAWRFATFHSLVPNTSVKLYPLLIERSGGQFLQYLLFLGALPPVLPLLALLDRRRTGRERRRLGFLVAVVAMVSFFFNFVAGGDYRPGFRYFVPTLPLLIAAIWYAFDLLAAEKEGARRRVARGILALLLALGPLHMLAQSPPQIRDWRRQVYERWLDPYSDENHWGVQIARWMKANVPPDSVVAFGQMGRIPYFLAHDGHPVTFVDTLGLIDRQVARIYRFDGKLKDLLRDMRAGRSPREALALGRRRRAVQLAGTVLARHPDFVMIETALDDYPMMQALRESAEFRSRYRQSGQLPAAGEPYVRIYTPVRPGAPR
ncbi:MAG TPA: hypothetical protein VGG20_05510 [Thermoanaerobaculia bacterium]|jgi:hypothetical protein